MRLKSLLGALAGACVAASSWSLAASQPAVTPGYTRVAEKPDGTIALEIASKTFERTDGQPGPRIHLVGAVHIGNKAYYDALQTLLDKNDLVLFEGVKPPGAGTFDTELDEAGKAKATTARLKFLATVVDEERTRLGELPQSLDEAVENAGKRWKTMIASSLTDAWGRKVNYALEETEKGSVAVITSSGPDGVDQQGGGDDLKATTTPSKGGKKKAKDPGLQALMAEALALTYQLEGMDSSRKNWRSSDMSVDQLQARFEAAGVAPDALFSMLDGTSLMGRLAGFAMSIIKSSPQLAGTMKLTMIDMLGSADDMLEGPMLPKGMKGMMAVILKDRNDVVLADLRAALEKEGHKDIAVFYGAGHMADMEAKLLKDFGYTPVREEWLEAITVTPKEVGMTIEQMKKQREAKRKAAERAAERKKKQAA